MITAFNLRSVPPDRDLCPTFRWRAAAGYRIAGADQMAEGPAAGGAVTFARYVPNDLYSRAM
jgi:hypothetical protein